MRKPTDGNPIPYYRREQVPRIVAQSDQVQVWWKPVEQEYHVVTFGTRKDQDATIKLSVWEARLVSRALRKVDEIPLPDGG